MRLTTEGGSPSGGRALSESPTVGRRERALGEKGVRVRIPASRRADAGGPSRGWNSHWNVVSAGRRFPHKFQSTIGQVIQPRVEARLVLHPLRTYVSFYSGDRIEI